jgi:hypothetical protein
VIEQPAVFVLEDQWSETTKDPPQRTEIAQLLLHPPEKRSLERFDSADYFMLKAREKRQAQMEVWRARAQQQQHKNRT